MEGRTTRLRPRRLVGGDAWSKSLLVRRGTRLFSQVGGGAFLFSLPSLAALLVFFVYPVATAIYDSFRGGSILDPITGGGFVGTANYAELLHAGDFWRAVLFSVVYAMVAVAGSYVVGLALALLLEESMPWRGLFRVLFLLPWVIPAVVSLTSWQWIVGTNAGIADTITRSLGFGTVLFLGSPKVAVGTVMAIKIWGSYPFMYMMMSSGLTGVDHSLYEAASVDGASRLDRIWHITLPSIRGVSWLACLLMAIFSVNDFTTIWLLTGGGPLGATTNLIVYAYNFVFFEFERGPGDAIAVITGAVMIMFSIVMVLRVRRSQLYA
jgi:multiple sugar transport system permease protein